MEGHPKDAEEEVESEEERGLLNEKETTFPKFLTSPQRFMHVPSHSSIYTEFYPPDLTKFSIEQCKAESQHSFCMTSAWRVISFFTVVFILPTILISIPLYARYHVYHARMLSLTDGDMQSFHRDVSSFWCRGQRVTSNGTFDAYLTKETRRLKHLRRISNFSSELFLTHDDVEQWGLHLIKGSTITFSTCSRWPGGTLLLVQGENNLRKCFYREERTIDQISNPVAEKRETKLNNLPLMKTNPTVASQPESPDEGGGEVVFEDDGHLTNQEIRQLYSSRRTNEKDSLLDATQYTSDVDSTLDTTIAPLLKEIDKKKIKGFKRNKKGKGRKRLRKLKQQQRKLKEDISAMVKRSIQPLHFSANLNTTSAVSSATSIPLFFSINDTFDVTTGNSSFSSSEEFLQQCSDTVVSIDLSPYRDCSRRASIDSMNDTLKWTFRVNQTDNYYFIFTSDNSIEANIISFRLLLERRLYDVSKKLDVCENKTECVFPFSFMKTEGVIVDFGERYQNISKLEDMNSYHLVSVCQPRSAVYTVFILLVPFIIIMFAFR